MGFDPPKISDGPVNSDPRAPVPEPVDDSRERQPARQPQGEAGRARDGALPGTGTYDPMSPPVGRMS